MQNMIRVAMAFLLVPTVPTTAARATDKACEALKAASFDHTMIVSTTMTPADTAASTPAFCEVTATISPVPGSRIGVVYRLPENWNGKMLGLGGGGWAGNVLLARAMPGLKKGYATAQTDAGHPDSDHCAGCVAPRQMGHSRDIRGFPVPRRFMR